MVKEKIIVWSDSYEGIEARAEEYAAEGYDYDNAIDIARNNNIDDLIGIRALAEKAKCGRILCYGKLGLWNGTAYGYKVFNSLKEVFFSDCDNIEWSVEGDDLCGYGSHHDGSNGYLYREISCDDEDLDELCEVIYESGRDEEKVKEYLERYTKPLKKTLEECHII